MWGGGGGGGLEAKSLVDCSINDVSTTDVSKTDVSKTDVSNSGVADVTRSDINNESSVGVDVSMDVYIMPDVDATLDVATSGYDVSLVGDARDDPGIDVTKADDLTSNVDTV